MRISAQLNDDGSVIFVGVVARAGEWKDGTVRRRLKEYLQEATE